MIDLVAYNEKHIEFMNICELLKKGSLSAVHKARMLDLLTDLSHYNTIYFKHLTNLKGK